MKNDALQVYIHIPFCRRKCAYCAFYSEPAATPEAVRLYLDKLERDLDAADIHTPVESVYFGGGTPSLLTEADLERLFDLTARRLPLMPDAEISLEANPETLTREKIRLIAAHVTRISLGIQSFDRELRSRLGRDCSDRAIAAALEWIGDAGFPHWNCDFIYAIPSQTRAQWEKELRRAADCGADHLSLYALTPEEGTRLAADPALQIDDDLAADLWKTAGERLAERGIFRYEVSNYARPGGECRHNQRVWQGGRLAGFGPAAASYDGECRFQEPASLSRWLVGEPPTVDRLPPERRRREILVMNLRTVAGWQRENYLALPGATPAEWEQILTAARHLEARLPGLLENDANHLRLTPRGLSFWDEVAMEWL